MKQILQSLASGETLLVETPLPQRSKGHVLSQSIRTLVSLGTEKMLLDFGKAGWIAKARQQPDKVKQVLQKIRTDGLLTTLDAVSAKLDQPIPLGYCHVGRVRECEPSSGYEVGDRIVSNGPHAEWVVVPENLTCKIPDEVEDEQAAFTVVGAIGLQGIRLLEPTLGERIAVFGLGLIGLMAVQMLRANGCQVIGIDFDRKKLELARRFGAETVCLADQQDPIAEAERWSGGQGVDGVLITASTKSQELIHQAATMCRKRGRVVLVGVVGLNLQRADFYEKELSFQVSCSYGPGRYDPQYEKKGLDYPIGFVRWTEQRNFEAVLNLMKNGLLDVKPLITHRIPFEEAITAYEVVSSGDAMGILLEYAAPSEQPIPSRTASLSPVSHPSAPRPATNASSPLVVGILGAGGFTTRMLLPILAKSQVRLKTIVSSTGVSATYAGRKFAFEQSSTDIESVLSDAEINTVLITTPHNSHAMFVQRCLEAGKHVFVEKPLALTIEELTKVQVASQANPHRKWMIGFNRRFSPHTVQLQKWLRAISGPKAVQITINAGAIDAEHWTQDPLVGGGRIVGEGCHFIDLARCLIGAPITSHHLQSLAGHEGRLGDNVFIHMGFGDGSIAHISYLANGHKSYPKERIEVFGGGKIAVCENFRWTHGYGFTGKCKTWKQDKGHAAGLLQFLDAIRHGTPQPIPVDEMLEVSRVAIELNQPPALAN